MPDRWRARGSVVSDADAVPPSYAKRLGEHLRAVREGKGLSLSAVARASDREFKAAALGNYERGERAISVPRLARLARIYGVPVDAPGIEIAPIRTANHRTTGVRRKVVANAAPRTMAYPLTSPPVRRGPGAWSDHPEPRIGRELRAQPGGRLQFGPGFVVLFQFRQV